LIYLIIEVNFNYTNYLILDSSIYESGNCNIDTKRNSLDNYLNTSIKDNLVKKNNKDCLDQSHKEDKTVFEEDDDEVDLNLEDF